MINYYTDTREDTIDAEELQLYKLIMDYRAANGLASIPLSQGLTITASRHALDTIYNEGRYVGHSWSDAPYDGSNSSTYPNMWEAPQRLSTTYQGYGFEITTGFAGTSLQSNQMTAPKALANWQGSEPHNNVILNRDIWTNYDWQAVGIGIHQGIAHVWFGKEVDSGGAPVIEGQPQSTISWMTQEMSIEVVSATYQFFTGSVPTSEGFEFLISSDANANDLNDPYYAPFNQENRFINFASNLGTEGDGRATYDAAYDTLSFDAAVRQAYDAIVGNQNAADLDAALNFFYSAETYYEALAIERGVARSGVSLEDATKIVMIGSLLHEATKGGTGIYGEAVEMLTADIMDDGQTNSFGMDLFA